MHETELDDFDWDGPIPTLEQVFQRIAAQESRDTVVSEPKCGRMNRAPENHTGVWIDYPSKSRISRVVPGSTRERLLRHMTVGGTTVEEVMELFKLSRKAAQYKIRDLHYQNGHGLLTRNGRVYLREQV